MLLLCACNAVIAVATVEAEHASMAVLAVLGEENIETMLQICSLIAAFTLFHVQTINGVLTFQHPMAKLAVLACAKGDTHVAVSVIRRVICERAVLTVKMEECESGDMTL